MPNKCYWMHKERRKRNWLNFKTCPSLFWDFKKVTSAYIYYMLLLGTLYILSHLMLSIIQWSRLYSLKFSYCYRDPTIRRSMVDRHLFLSCNNLRLSNVGVVWRLTVSGNQTLFIHFSVISSLLPLFYGQRWCTTIFWF